MDLRIDIPDQDLKNGYAKLALKPGSYMAGPIGTKLVVAFQQLEFFRKEIALWKSNEKYRGMPLRTYLYLNRIKHSGKDATQLTPWQVLRGFRIAGITKAMSHFSPLWIRKFIQEFEVKSIYDPCGGWGHRLLGVGKDFRYAYNDINKPTKDNCERMAEFFGMTNKEFYDKDAATFAPPGHYDAVFTCPPYFNTEIYSDHGAENFEPDQFKDWWADVVKSSLRVRPRLFAFVINNKYRDDMHSIVLSNPGLKLVKEVTIGPGIKNHFQRKEGARVTKSELLLVYSVEIC